MRKNCICLCGTQFRAPISQLTKGMQCPNCNRVIAFQETAPPYTTGTSDHALARDLDFNTQQTTPWGRLLSIPKWLLYWFALTPLLTAIALFVPFATDRLGFSRAWPKPEKIESPVQMFQPVSIDWEKIQQWNTNFDLLGRSFPGSTIANEIVKKVPASKYEALEGLFGYDTMLAKCVDRKEQAQVPSGLSLELIERKLSHSVRAFLTASQSVTPGYHDWRVIGTASQDHSTALLIRYYRESETMADMLDDQELLMPLIKLIDFGQFNLYCNNVFLTKQTVRNVNAKLPGYQFANFYANKNYGYLVLVLSDNQADHQIQDMFDFQIQRPLSEFCLIWTGASNLNISDIPSGNMQLPGPLDSDILLVQDWLKNMNNSASSVDPETLRSKLESIHKQTNDPLMHDFLGRLENQLGNPQQALEYFRKAKSDRFESLDSHRAFLREALQAKDTNLLIQRLHDLNNYWDIKLTGIDAQEDRKQYYKFQHYWSTVEPLYVGSGPRSD